MQIHYGIKTVDKISCLLKELNENKVIWKNYLRTPKVVTRFEAIKFTSNDHTCMLVFNILALLLTMNTKSFHKLHKMHGTAEAIH